MLIVRHQRITSPDCVSISHRCVYIVTDLDVVRIYPNLQFLDAPIEAIKKNSKPRSTKRKKKSGISTSHHNVCEKITKLLVFVKGFWIIESGSVVD